MPALKDAGHGYRLVPGGLGRQLHEGSASYHEFRQSGRQADKCYDRPSTEGSPISPALFAIHIAEIHDAVECQVKDSRGISFMDDITWLVEGTDLNDVVSKLECCVAASL